MSFKDKAWHLNLFIVQNTLNSCRILLLISFQMFFNSTEIACINDIIDNINDQIFFQAINMT